MKRPRLPFPVMSSAMSPQISPERMPVSSPKRSALCSTLSLALRRILTCASLSIPWGFTSGLSLTLRASQGLASQLPLTHTPVKELGHLLEDTRLGLGCQGGASRSPGRALQALAKPAPLPSLYLRTLGESWVMYPSTSLPWAWVSVSQLLVPQMRVRATPRQSAPTCNCRDGDAETPQQGRLEPAPLPTHPPQDEHADIEGEPPPVEELGQAVRVSVASNGERGSSGMGLSLLDESCEGLIQLCNTRALAWVASPVLRDCLRALPRIGCSALG